MSEECTHNCETCGAACASRKQQPEDFHEPPHALSSIKKVIGVVSGKGGVGKSMTSAMLAVLLNRRGYKTGVLDADITGPSIPKLFGIHGRAHADEVGCYPVQSRTGIDVMSVNLLLEHESDPVVWRGPIIAGTVKQFWQEVIWKDVDFLFVDMPPGTGDVPLTVFQTLPVDGIVIVSSPQELVGMIVGKAVQMAQMMHVPILGLVENMAWFTPAQHPDERYYIFGRDGGVELAKELGVRLLAQIPLVTDVCDDGDAGTPIALKDTVMAHEFIHLAHEVTDAVAQRNEQLPPTQKVELKK